MSIYVPDPVEVEAPRTPEEMKVDKAKTVANQIRDMPIEDYARVREQILSIAMKETQRLLDAKHS